MKLKLYYTKKISKWFIYLGISLAVCSLLLSVLSYFNSELKNALLALIMSALLFLASWNQINNQDKVKEQIIEVDRYEVIN